MTSRFAHLVEPRQLADKPVEENQDKSRFAHLAEPANGGTKSRFADLGGAPHGLWGVDEGIVPQLQREQDKPVYFDTDYIDPATAALGTPSDPAIVNPDLTRYLAKAGMGDVDERARDEEHYEYKKIKSELDEAEKLLKQADEYRANVAKIPFEQRREVIAQAGMDYYLENQMPDSYRKAEAELKKGRDDRAKLKQLSGEEKKRFIAENMDVLGEIDKEVARQRELTNALTKEKAFIEGKPTHRNIFGVLESWKGTGGEMVLDWTMGLMQTAGEHEVFNWTGYMLPGADEESKAKYQAELKSFHESMAKTAVDYMEGYKRYMHEHPEFQKVGMNPSMDAFMTAEAMVKHPENTLQAALEAFPIMAMAYLGSLTGGASKIGAYLGSVAGIATPVFGGNYAEARREGATPKEALYFALPASLWEAAVEGITFGRYSGYLKRLGRSFWGKIIHSAWREGIEEGAQTLGTNVAKLWTYKPDQDIFEGVEQSIGAAAPVGAFFGLFLGGIGESVAQNTSMSELSIEESQARQAALQKEIEKSRTLSIEHKKEIVETVEKLKPPVKTVAKPTVKATIKAEVKLPQLISEPQNEQVKTFYDIESVIAEELRDNEVDSYDELPTSRKLSLLGSALKRLDSYIDDEVMHSEGEVLTQERYDWLENERKKLKKQISELKEKHKTNIKELLEEEEVTEKEVVEKKIEEVKKPVEKVEVKEERLEKERIEALFDSPAAQKIRASAQRVADKSGKPLYLYKTDKGKFVLRKSAGGEGWSIKIKPKAEEAVVGEKLIAGKKVEKEAERAKEPWEMTKEEYEINFIFYKNIKHAENAIQKAIRKGAEYSDFTIIKKDDGWLLRPPMKHSWIVEKALSEGKAVPAEVLKDYPDLVKEEPITTERYQEYLAKAEKREVPASELKVGDRFLHENGEIYFVIKPPKAAKKGSVYIQDGNKKVVKAGDKVHIIGEVNDPILTTKAGGQFHGEEGKGEGPRPMKKKPKIFEVPEVIKATPEMRELIKKKEISPERQAQEDRARQKRKAIGERFEWDKVVEAINKTKKPISLGELARKAVGIKETTEKAVPPGKVPPKDKFGLMPEPEPDYSQPSNFRTAIRAVKAVMGEVINVVDQGWLVSWKHGPKVYARVQKAIHLPEAMAGQWDMEDLTGRADTTIGQLMEHFDKKYTTQQLMDINDARPGARTEPFSEKGKAVRIDAMSRLTREMEDDARLIQDIADLNYDALQTVKPDFESYFDDYFYGIFKDTAAARNFADHYRTTKRFLKEKKMPTMADARAYGLELRNENPIANLRSEFQAIVRLKAMENLRNYMMKEGMGVYIVQKDRANSEQMRSWEKIEDPIFNELFGEVLVEGDLAKLINNLIAVNKVSRSKTARSFRSLNYFLRSVKFIGSAFHQGVIIKQIIADAGGPLQFLNPVNWNRLRKQIFSRGFRKFDPRFKDDSYFKYMSLGGEHRYSLASKSQKAFQRLMTSKEYSWLWRTARMPGRVATVPFRGYINWLFNNYIPEVKYLKYLDMVKKGEAKLGRQLTDAEHIDIIKEGQNFYGMINERLFGRSATATSVLRFFFMAPGFREGNYRTMGNVFIPSAGRSRWNVPNSLILTSMAATIGTLIMTGKMPKRPEDWDEFRDLFKIKTGWKDNKGRDVYIDLATYDKDYIRQLIKPMWMAVTGKPLEASKDAIDTFIKTSGGMVSPGLAIGSDVLRAAQGLALVDYKPERVYFRTDPALEKWRKVIAHTLHKLEPIPYSVYRQMRYKGIEPCMALFGAAMGLRPAYSELDKRVNDLARDMFDLRRKQEDLYWKLGTIGYPRDAIKSYNATVKEAMESDLYKKLGIETRRSFDKRPLTIDVNKLLGNKVYRLLSPSTDDAEKERIRNYLGNFDVKESDYDKLLEARSYIGNPGWLKIQSAMVEDGYDVKMRNKVAGFYGRYNELKNLKRKKEISSGERRELYRFTGAKDKKGYIDHINILADAIDMSSGDRNKKRRKVWYEMINGLIERAGK